MYVTGGVLILFFIIFCFQTEWWNTLVCVRHNSTQTFWFRFRYRNSYLIPINKNKRRQHTLNEKLRQPTGVFSCEWDVDGRLRQSGVWCSGVKKTKRKQKQPLDWWEAYRFVDRPDVSNVRERGWCSSGGWVVIAQEKSSDRYRYSTRIRNTFFERISECRDIYLMTSRNLIYFSFLLLTRLVYINLGCLPFLFCLDGFLFCFFIKKEECVACCCFLLLLFYLVSWIHRFPESSGQYPEDVDVIEKKISRKKKENK